MSVLINIPEKHYIGINPNNNDHTMMTPGGSDSLALKRKANLDSKMGKENCVEITNQPMVGFVVNKGTIESTHWGSSNYTTWKISDPRGFKMEISSTNLEHILRNCTVENMEIQDKCVWGRTGSYNVLIPVTSKYYKDALLNSDRMKNVADKSELSPGDYFITHTGTIGMYLGKIYETISFVNDGQILPKFKSSKYYMLVGTGQVLEDSYPEFEKKFNKGDYGRLKIINHTTKVSKIIKSNISIDDSILEDVLSKINNGELRILGDKKYLQILNGYRYSNTLYFLKKPKVTKSLYQYNQNDLDLLANLPNRDSVVFGLTESKNAKYISNIMINGRNGKFDIKQITGSEIRSTEMVEDFQDNTVMQKVQENLIKQRSYYYGYHSNNHRNVGVNTGTRFMTVILSFDDLELYLI